MINQPGEQPLTAAPHFNFMNETNTITERTIVAIDGKGQPLFFTCPKCGSHRLGAVIYATYKDVSGFKKEYDADLAEHIMQCVECLEEFEHTEAHMTATPEDKL